MPGGVGRWQALALALMAMTAAAILVALILTLGSASRQRDRALELQRHSYDVMILARTLSGTIARAEASLGRYVISGDRQLGRLYVEEWTLARSQIDRLEIITDDNRGQNQLIQRLRTAYDARGGELATTALSTSYGKNRLALSLYNQARNAGSLAEINRDLDRIIAHERTLLDRRAAAAEATVEQSSRIAGILAVFGVLIVLGAVVLGWLILRATNERTLARADAEAASEQAAALSAAVAIATGELRAQEAQLRQVQKMDAVGQLTGGIAHDFNNMLAVVLGGLELATRSRDLDAARRHLESATEGATRAAALTRRLLAFSREESLKLEPIAAADLIANMSDLLDRTLGDGVTLMAANEADGWYVRADRVQLENVVLNLAVNARDAVAGRGTITITTGAVTLATEAVNACAAGDYVTLAVADDGCGMTSEIAERVFEPFFTTKEAGKGTGLGLSQIFAFVRQQGGEIAIDTAPGRGTAVTLYLPRDLSPEHGAAIEAPPPDAAPYEGGYDILAVEDDPRVLTATIGALEELGHRPVPCPDPLAAPVLLARHPEIALVISDVQMPQQTGPEMIALLLGSFPHLAVLFVTGYAGEAGAADLGEHHLLRKPFTLAALDRAIAETMRGRSIGFPGPDAVAAE